MSSKDPSIVPFGGYKGRTWDTVPRQYLSFIARSRAGHVTFLGKLARKEIIRREGRDPWANEKLKETNTDTHA